MHITWVIAGPLSSRGGRIYSPRASLRYRCLIPAEVLIARGHTVEFLRADEIERPDGPIDADFGDVIVFVKSFHPVSEALAARASGLGRRVVVDFCDLDFADREALRIHRGRLAAAASRTVAASETLARAVRDAFTVPLPAVIPDPYELAPGRPRFAPARDAVRLAWYGSPANLPDLFAVIDPLARLGGTLGRVLSLTAVTEEIAGMAEAFAAANRKFADRLSMTFVDWSLESLSRVLETTDIVVLPSAVTEKTRAKTANRAVEALRRGRFVVASPLPGVIPLGDSIRLDDDIAAGVRWTLEHGQLIEDRIAAGQDYIAVHHSPDAVADGWLAAMSGTSR